MGALEMSRLCRLVFRTPLPQRTGIAHGVWYELDFEFSVWANTDRMGNFRTHFCFERYCANSGRIDDVDMEGKYCGD